MNQVGRYQILEELGRGACGVVYRALDPAIGRTVAIKSIRFSDFSDSEERRDLRDRVLREAQAAGKLSHPNIVTIYDVLESNDLAYIFMEFVDGPSLKDAMRRSSPTREQILGVLRQIAEALDYAHRKGIIHRDIKPANIMISDRGVDREGAAKIADFGIAKLISHEATHQRAFMGTPSYMSPEQLEGVAVSGSSDQFALAVIVYELLTGDKPFAAENLAALHYLICKRPANPVHEMNPALNDTVNRVMEKAMAKLPEDRFSSCGEFIGALSFALGDCLDWQPMAPREQEVAHAGNGWYAPETVVSSRLTESDPAAIDPVVLPPAENVFENPATTRIRTEPRRTDGTKVRIGVEKPAARRLGLTMAACAIVAVLGILLLKLVSAPRPHLEDTESKRIVTTHPPDDLTPVPTPIATDTTATSTTVSVRAQQAPPRPMPVESAPVQPVQVKPPRPAVRVAEPKPIQQPMDVEIVSDPPGANVMVDNQSSCLAPCNLPLTPGRHTLLAQLGGFGNTRKIFTVPVQGSVFVSLMRNMGMLLLTTNPPGTMVAVDGREYGPTPVRISLPAGKHHLSLSNGSRNHDETIAIESDGVYARKFNW